MKKNLFSLVVGLLGLFLSTGAFALDAGNYSSYVEENCKQIVNKESYDVCYNYEFRGPVFGKTIIDGTKTEAGIIKRPNFREEQELPDEYAVSVSDYNGKGKIYNIGHIIATDADVDYDKDLLRETYSLVNTIPQAYKFNQVSWLKLERFGREMAKHFGSIEAWTLIDYTNKTQDGKLIIPGTVYRIYNKPGVFRECFKYENTSNFNSKVDKIQDHKISCEGFEKFDDFVFEQ